jgi:hypothetical protein
MFRTLEDFTPYEHSRVWRLHDAYYARAGAAAWTSGDVPYVATSSYAMARQNARVLLALVKDLERSGALGPTDPVSVLEVGSGLGLFAANLLHALAKSCGKAGRELYPRIKYVLSDYSSKTLVEVVAREPLAREVRAGRILPALLDLSAPESIKTLEGVDLAGDFSAVFANYVCCVVPPTILCKTTSGVERRVVRVDIRSTPDQASRPVEALWEDFLLNATRPGLMKDVELVHEWRPIALEDVLPDPIDRTAFARLTARFAEATVAYPRRFLDFSRWLSARMIRGGALFVGDVGSVSTGDFEGRGSRPASFGNTVNHGVNFAVFDEFCRAAGFGLIRTRNPFESVHRAALVYGGPPGPALTRAFRRCHVREDQGQEFLNLRIAAKALRKTSDLLTLTSVYRRLADLDPLSPVWHFRLGDVCYRMGRNRLAIRHLRLGRKVDTDQSFDFDFHLGRSYFCLQLYDKAIDAFRGALSRRKHVPTWFNLGAVYEKLDRLDEARTCYEEAMALGPAAVEAAAIQERLRVMREP